MNFNWFVVCFLAVVSAERLWEMRASRLAVRGEKRQGWSLPLFLLLHATILVAVGVERFVWDWPVQPGLMAIGAVLVVVALVLRLAAIRTLGKFWSLHVEIRQEHRLIQEGPYRYMRHPAYAAIILEFIGIPLVGNCYYALLLAVVAYLPVLAVRMVGEERALVEKFGEAYVNYQRQVFAVLPLRRLPRE